ncbi:Glycine receptor subunit alphaZ1-like protein, partial [Dinothrombium tinctorium]
MEKNFFLCAVLQMILVSDATHLVEIIVTKNYDRLLPPKPNDNEAVQVNVSMHVLNVRSVRTKDLSFTVDLFIHQKWIDDRLMFPKNMTKDKFISLQSVWKQRIWNPITFFKNGIAGDLTSENFRTNYFLLYENKIVQMSSRVSVVLVCEMDFSKYPHDYHFCNISLMNRSFSCISSTMILKRNMGNTVPLKYIPSLTIVVAAFVNFWVPINTIPARISLVVTSLLALITQQLQITSGLRTSYTVAINIWMNLCTTLVFLCLIETAIAIIWEQKKKRKTAKINPVDEEEAETENKIKKLFQKLEKQDRNPIDQASKCLFPSIFMF